MDTIKDYEGAEHQVDVQGLTLAEVASVYSGKAHACCCGCAGKHSYHAATRKEASKNRGYKLTDDELNEKQCTRVLNLVKKNVATAQYMVNDHIATEVGNRLYIVYLTKASGR